MSHKVGDTVWMPDGHVATVVYLGRPDKKITVETPWSAQWLSFEPNELTTHNYAAR